MLNLTVGASVLPVCGVILQTGYAMTSLFAMMSAIAVLVALAALVLPQPDDAHRLDHAPAE